MRDHQSSLRGRFVYEDAADARSAMGVKLELLPAGAPEHYAASFQPNDAVGRFVPPHQALSLKGEGESPFG